VLRSLSLLSSDGAKVSPNRRIVLVQRILIVWSRLERDYSTHNSYGMFHLSVRRVSSYRRRQRHPKGGYSDIGSDWKLCGVSTCNLDSRRWQTSSSPQTTRSHAECGRQETDNAFVRGRMPTTGRHTTRARRTSNHDQPASNFGVKKRRFVRIKTVSI